MRLSSRAIPNRFPVFGKSSIVSKDEKTLYVNGYGEGTIWRFDVMADGTIMKQAMPFATGLTEPDSLCLDAAGNLYVADTQNDIIRRIDTNGNVTTIAGAAGIAGLNDCARYSESVSPLAWA